MLNFELKEYFGNLKKKTMKMYFRNQVKLMTIILISGFNY